MQTRTNRKESFFFNNILPPKTVEEVKEDVEQWARQHNQELEILQKNEQYRKEFLQNLSHELKTPIFSIQGYIDTLLSGAMDNPEVNKNFLKNTSRNIDRLVNLVDDLDQISRLELGELKLNYDFFVIEELIQEVYDAFSLRCQEAKIQCSFKKEREKNLQVYADREKVRQVLVNIIDNAIKYGKVNGTIEAAFFKLDKNIALIEIRDDGDGIAEEHRQRIFERFYRTDHARSRKIGGSGLGLAICKHILDAHQQTIYVRSAVQVGSTFCFSLPLKK
jgi:two-component system phosphate regulon sensor histidine kinase PhoR